MEEKQLEASESIALISRMIENTRNRMERHAGRDAFAEYVAALESYIKR